MLKAQTERQLPRQSPPRSNTNTTGNSPLKQQSPRSSPNHNASNHNTLPNNINNQIQHSTFKESIDGNNNNNDILLQEKAGKQEYDIPINDINNSRTNIPLLVVTPPNQTKNEETDEELPQPTITKFNTPTRSYTKTTIGDDKEGDTPGKAAAVDALSIYDIAKVTLIQAGNN